ncbi:hypothetical protein PTSG_06795 [Salpingoeca rosetta]|uniref:Protein FAM136A n=1 Tax=Salpingoeca rosetta (strain ATCC 50818 / BSB-021) TaxID=946362 RepID=F2UEU0_SALR5|nr:uncharacterized protein PTSG_06795 [Salpingoeca rosetta]EGD75140.1 hypothetical protein PTSG_06795 [Salpingoeca rosetta]|eukprot:XP_004992193.1 hypothetical protein PTSG_06795 [Salpingoeca rosetta]
MADQNKLEQVFEEHYNVFERKLRQQQRAEFLCCATCSENPNMSAKDYNECLQKCKAPLTAFSEVMQKEIGNFQERYMRCARDCEDRIRDRITPDMQSLPPHLEEELKACASKCSSSHAALVPGLFKKLDEYAKHFASKQ